MSGHNEENVGVLRKYKLVILGEQSGTAPLRLL